MMRTLKKVALARQMRRALTEPELILWFRLKDRSDGLAFRNQHPIGPYIADFYCAKAKLIIEIDGALHVSGERAERDAARDRYFSGKGYMTYRIPAAEVYRDADSVADGIRLLAEERIKEKQDTPPHDRKRSRSPSPNLKTNSGRYKIRYFKAFSITASASGAMTA